MSLSPFYPNDTIRNDSHAVKNVMRISAVFYI